MFEHRRVVAGEVLEFIAEQMKSLEALLLGAWFAFVLRHCKVHDWYFLGEISAAIDFTVQFLLDVCEFVAKFFFYFYLLARKSLNFRLF